MTIELTNANKRTIQSAVNEIIEGDGEIADLISELSEAALSSGLHSDAALADVPDEEWARADKIATVLVIREMVGELRRQLREAGG